MSGYLTTPLKRAASLAPGKVATIDGQTRRTWQETLDRVARLAGALRRLGLETGDRVAIYSRNSSRFFELHFAIPWAGGGIVPVNTRLSPPEVGYVLQNAAPRVLFVDAHFLPMLRQVPAEAVAGRKLVVLGDEPLDGLPCFEALLAEAEPLPDMAPGGGAMAGIFYTGGSTGRSKGVVLTHDNLLTNAMNTLIGVGYRQDSVYLHAAPMFHLTDGMSTFSLTMALGTHVFMPQFDATKALELVQEHRVTNLTLVPTMIEMMARAGEGKGYDFSSLRQFQFGSAPMPEATLERALRLWPDAQFLHGWGMTELSPIGMMLPHELRDPRVAGRRLRSVGVPAVNEEIRIVDAEFNDVPRGKVGEIVVRGPMVTGGYWNLPEETEKAFHEGWFRTGDAGYQDDEGLYYIADRLKDMIITGGENVYSVEVESVLSLCPGVDQVAVIGLPHPTWGEEVCAVVLPVPGQEVDPEAVRTFARERIAGYKVPKRVILRDSPLPLTSAGKIRKKALREEYGAG